MNAFNPYGFGINPMPNRLDSLQQQMNQPYYSQPMQNNIAPQRVNLLGYIVNNIDEAKNARIDFDGSTSYFPCPSESVIYAKSIDLDGRAVMQIYKLQNAQQVQYADNATVLAMQERLDKMASVLKELGYDESATNHSNSTK